MFLLAICIGGVLLARRAFLKVEVVPKQSLTLDAVSDRLPLSVFRNRIPARSSRNWITSRPAVQFRKELRELAPVGVFAILVIAGWAVIQLISDAFDTGTGFWDGASHWIPLVTFFFIGYILIHAIAIQPFTSESENGTLSFCLTQPVSRMQIWLWKLAAVFVWLAGGILFTIAAGGVVSIIELNSPRLMAGSDRDMVAPRFVAELGLFASGAALYALFTAPLAALLLRRRAALILSAGSALFIIIAAVVIFSILYNTGLTSDHRELLIPKDISRFWTSPVLLAAMVLGVVLGTRRFLRLQV